MQELREAIELDRLEEYVEEFYARQGKEGARLD